MNGDDNIQGILTDRDRTLAAAWMLPHDGPLTDAQRRQAMDNLNGYLRRNKLTIPEVSRQVGSITITTIGELTRHVYRSGADTNIRTLNNWLEQHARARAARPGEGFIETRIAKSMQIAAKLVREHGTMGLVYGSSGIGKTRCCQAIFETTPGAVYIRAIRDHSTAKGLQGCIADKLGVRGRSSGKNLADGHSGSQIDRVLQVLGNSNRLIIIDEADLLKPSALELLRDIHDVAGVPILLVSTKELYERVTATRKEDGGQLYSRFDVIINLVEGHNSYNAGKPLFTVDDIKSLFQQVPIRLSPDATNYLKDVANRLGEGSLRRCRVLVQGAARRARMRQGLGDADEVTITADDLEWYERNLRREGSEDESITERKRIAAVVA